MATCGVAIDCSESQVVAADDSTADASTRLNMESPLKWFDY
jgi:hypothetical protein